MPVPTGWHPGEVLAQQARGFEDDVRDAWMLYQEGAPSFMVAFLEALPFLSVTTLDEQGRPWSSILCNDGKAGFIKLIGSEDDSRFQCTIQAPLGVPIRECLLRLYKELKADAKTYDDNGDVKSKFQLAGVGVMLHNRRRNKLEGVITQINEIPSSDKESRFVFQLELTSTFGNCPKCEHHCAF